MALAAPWIAHGRLVQGHAVGAGAALLAPGAAHTVVVSVMGGITLAWVVAAGPFAGIGRAFVWAIVLVFWHILYSVYGCVRWRVGLAVKAAAAAAKSAYADWRESGVHLRGAVTGVHSGEVV